MEDKRIDRLETKIENLEAKFDNLEPKIDKLSEDTTRILYYLDSDPKTKRAGVIEEMFQIRETLSALLTREQIYKAKAGVWGIIGAALFTLAKSAIAFIIPFLK